MFSLFFRISLTFRAIERVILFSSIQGCFDLKGQTAPGSFPPCPGSITTTLWRALLTLQLIGANSEKTSTTILKGLLPQGFSPKILNLWASLSDIFIFVLKWLMGITFTSLTNGLLIFLTIFLTAPALTSIQSSFPSNLLYGVS